MRVQVIDYGARLFAMWVPAVTGSIDVLAGFETPDGFRGANPYFNAMIGRVANRLPGGVLPLGGKIYHLNCNEDGVNHLHGGVSGFDRKMWTVLSAEGGAITMRYVSPDGEEHYPGTLTVTVTYRLHEDNSLTLDYVATTDRDTPVNLTNHAYFNLKGTFDTVLDHEVTIFADRVIPVDEHFVSYGDIFDVTDTIYDFRTPHAIGARLVPIVPRVYGKGGYDNGYILNPHSADAPVAIVHAPSSGVTMRVYTDRPVLQFYSGNFLDGVQGKRFYDYQSAFCMETQDYSNAPNVPTFPSITLPAGGVYTSHTRYAFSVEGL
jgi:aldose 1-epimerase